MEFKSNKDELLKLLDKAKAEAFKEIIEVSVASVRAITPVDTGKLRGSIEGRVKSEEMVEIGTSVEYSLFVEKGTSRQKAQPFLQPGVLREIDTFIRIFEEKLNK